MSSLLTVQQVAAILNVSEKTVMRRFSKIEGVVDLGTPETSKRRRYRVLRIPRGLVEKFILKRGGHLVIPDAPTPKRKPRVQLTEEDIVRDLLAVSGDSGAAARKKLEKIVEKAWAMTWVPRDRRKELLFFEDEN